MTLELKKIKAHCLHFATVKKTAALSHSHQYGVAVSTVAPSDPVFWWSRPRADPLCLYWDWPWWPVAHGRNGGVRPPSCLWLPPPPSVFAASRKSATASCEHFLPRGGGPRAEELGPPADRRYWASWVGSPGPAVPPVAVALNSAWLQPCERPGARTTRLGSSQIPDPQKLMWPQCGLKFDSREFQEGFLNLDFQRKFYVKKCMQGFLLLLLLFLSFNC